MACRYLLVNGVTRSEITYYKERGVNPLESFSDEQLIKEFRISKAEILFICDLVRDDMQTLGSRSCDLTLEQKVLICLKTLASGCFQNVSKDFVNASQPTVSTMLTAFVNCMVKKASQFIYMPTSRDDIIKVKCDFYQEAGLPGVIGCVDCTHIPIIAPHEDEYAYVNRKKFHSINVQGVCDANLVFLNVVAKWPGSHHDSFILQNSSLYNKFEHEEFGDSWLLGDSAYSLKKWLITPHPSPITDQERHFNVIHRKTRSFIERSFGVLKMRWRILDHTGGNLCYDPRTRPSNCSSPCCQ